MVIKKSIPKKVIKKPLNEDNKAEEIILTVKEKDNKIISDFKRGDVNVIISQKNTYDINWMVLKRKIRLIRNNFLHFFTFNLIKEKTINPYYDSWSR